MNRPLIIALLFGLLVLVRVTAPTDFLEGDQEKQVGYVMDILHHGNWLIQYETTGEIATKPPVYNWCAALLCQLFNSRAEWVIKLPSLLAGAGLLVCLWCIAKKLFDERTAFYACIACIASHHFAKLFWFARTDMLMVFLLHLAIALVICLRAAWWKSPLIGLVLALAALTKGPVAPLLFVLFLIAWGWHEESLRSVKAWKRLIPGAVVFTVVAGAWLIAVWEMPQFQDHVLKWQLGSRMVEARIRKPIYYHIPHIFTRIAPWTFIAVLAVFRARRREDWPTARFVLLWGLTFFTLFSLVPVKRHDHLLPVYPAVFVLAGLGLRYLLEPVVSREANWILYPMSAALALAPTLLAWVSEPQLHLIVAGIFACGLSAHLLCYYGLRASFATAAAGLILVHGIYHHWGHQQGRADYDQLASFAAKVKATAGEGEDIAVFQAHPLIAYELGQHDPLPNPEELAQREPTWIVAPDYFREMIESATHWKLSEQFDMNLHPRRDRATLFRVERDQKFAEAESTNIH